MRLSRVFFYAKEKCILSVANLLSLYVDYGVVFTEFQ